MANLQLSHLPQPEDDNQLQSISRHSLGESIEASLLLDLFPVYLAERSRSIKAHTLTNYGHQVRPFWEWWAIIGPQRNWQLSKNDLRQFPDWLRNEWRTQAGAKPSRNTVHTCVGRVRAFLRWLHQSGRSPIDLSEWLPLPSLPLPQPRVLSRDEIQRLFAAGQGPLRIRNMALLAFLLETGARRFEAAAATWENIRFNSDFTGVCYLEVVKGYLDFDKRRTVVFGVKSGKLLQLLRIAYGSDTGDVFNLTGSGIGQTITALANTAGVNVAAHDFRRTFATHWMKNCVAVSPSLAEQLLDVQLGHSPQTIAQRHYISLTADDVAAHYVSPLDNVDLFGL